MTTTINHIDNTRLHAGAMDDTAPPDPEVPERSSGRRQFSAKYKAKILAEYDALPRSARGEMLRREGLYSSLIITWRRQRDQGAEVALARPAGRQKADPRDREIARLERKVDRLTGELDKSRRVVEIQAKLSALLEQVATDSTAENGEQR
jgi:transposase